ncbi:SH3 domain-containing protein [Agarilytica rhodophyticola]|uniref:SH3 domain-containing protein n=1 Tax=Agarilytica rhodophyticola TaxID=1737490 RepID=UPI001FE9EC30|nr:SH3 domain-containing protein [Agarilytica rhodophyticola]
MMIKRFAGVVISCLCCLAPVAQAGIWDFFVDEGLHLVVSDPYVEMRTGPGRGYPVFHVIEKGQTLHLFKKRTDWYKAETKDGVKGWIKRSELSKTLGPDGSEVDFSAPNWQDYVDRRWEFGVLGGNFESSDALTTYLGFNLTQNISAELKYTQTFSSVSNNKLLSINAVHKPFPSWKISPFFTLGAGEIKISPSSSLVRSEERENPVYTVGGGTFVYISRRFLFRLEYNNHTLLTKREDNEEVEEWKAGFSVFF